MKSPLRAESRGLPLEASSSPSWAEELKGAELSVARSRARVRQKNESQARGPWSAQACPLNLFTGVKSVGLFAPRRDWHEPADLDSLFPASLSLRRLYPSLEGNELSFFATSTSELKSNAKWGVQEAPHRPGAAIVPDLLFVPCLFADFEGNRIGRGGGFYDRFLSQHPEVVAVAVLHSDFVLRKMPSSWLHSGDQKMAALVSDAYFVHFKQNGESL